MIQISTDQSLEIVELLACYAEDQLTEIEKAEVEVFLFCICNGANDQSCPYCRRLSELKDAQENPNGEFPY